MTVHGRRCNSQTFPTNCRDCGDPIFVFTCNCGSAVLFDELGQPWPKHRCRSWSAPGGNFRVDENYGVQVRKAEQNRTATSIIRVAARDADTYRGRGLVREVSRDVDIFAKLGLPAPTPMAAAVLGDLARQKVAQVTVHVEDQGAAEFRSFTFLCADDVAGRLDIERHDFLDLQLEAVSIPGGKNLWKAVRVEQLFR